MIYDLDCEGETEDLISVKWNSVITDSYPFLHFNKVSFNKVSFACKLQGPKLVMASHSITKI